MVNILSALLLIGAKSGIMAMAMTVPTASPTTSTPTSTSTSSTVSAISSSPSSSSSSSSITIIPRPTRAPGEENPVVKPWFFKLGNDTYQSCGYSRAGEMLCPSDHVCIDNPDPSSCGQSCDDMGVCLKLEGARVCGESAGPCPDHGRCERVVFGCIPDDADPYRCAGLCFPDYWDGQEDWPYIRPGDAADA